MKIATIDGLIWFRIQINIYERENTIAAVKEIVRNDSLARIDETNYTQESSLLLKVTMIFVD